MDTDDIARRTLRCLEWERLKTFLSREAESQPGQAACLALEPALARAEVEQLLAQTHEASALLQARSALCLAGLPELTEIIGRLGTGAALSGRELISIKTTLNIARQSRLSLVLLPSESFQHLPSFVPRLHALEDLFMAIEGALDNVGEVKDEASPALRSLRKEMQRIDNSIKDELLKIIHSSTLSKALQEPIFTQRNGRYVLPVNANLRAQIHGIVHDSSASGLTVYIEPMVVVELANRMRIKESEIEHEIARILQELSSRAAKRVTEIDSSFQALVELDLIMARARLASCYGGHMPALSQDRHFEFRGARHPLLVLQNSAFEVIANDIALGGDLGQGRTLVITGPNTGGKTVLLKTVGIFALMVRAGLFPAAAPGSVAAFFPLVCADIGDEQSIEQSLSTFSSHLKNIIEIVDAAKDGMLVLLDEVGAGTDPREGAALARAVLESLNRSGAVTIGTTHYGELKTLAYTEPGFVNGSLDFNEITLSPSYRLRIGVPGSSKATTIARRLGLNESIVERARALMQSNEQDLERVVSRLEHKLKELDEREQEATKTMEAAKHREAEAQAQLTRWQDEAQARRAKLSQGIDEEFKLSLDYIKHVIADLQKQPSLSKAQKAQSDLEKLKKELGWSQPPRPADEKTAQVFTVGQTVRVRSLGRTAVVEESAGDRSDPKRQVLVRAGNLKIKVAVGDLEPVQGSALAKKGGATAKRQGAGASLNNRESQPSAPPPFVRTERNTLDVRGERVDDALAEVERFLDESSLGSSDVVMIIHGHGTGAVRTAVRNYLSESGYAKSFRPGEMHEGGNGVTIVRLKS